MSAEGWSPRFQTAPAPRRRAVKQSNPPPTIRARVADNDVDGERWTQCGACHIRYITGRNGCPLCETKRQLLRATDAVTQMRNSLELQTDRLHDLEAEVDTARAMTNAIDLLDDRDTVFIKDVLYRYRSDVGAVALKTHMHDSGHGPTPGFLAVFTQEDPVAHPCSSIGGAAIAAAYAKDAKAVGSAKALARLIRALAPMLADPKTAT